MKTARCTSRMLSAAALLLLHLLLLVRLAEGAFNYEIGNRILDVIEAYLDQVERALDVPLSAFYLNDDPGFTDETSYAVNQLFPCITVYANQSYVVSAHVALEADGAFFGYAIMNDVYYYRMTDAQRFYDADNLTLYSFNTDWNGNPVELFDHPGPLSNVTYDPRKQPWYNSVKLNLSKSWSQPYYSLQSYRPVVSVIYPIFNKTFNGYGDKTFIGTVGFDVNLQVVDSLLKIRFSEADVEVFIIDISTGYLLGNNLNASNSEGTGDETVSAA
jgi:hypothetical protein